MKGFQFRLERVLSWRRTQLTLAEAKAEQLKGALCAIDTAMMELARRRTASQEHVSQASVVSGVELEMLERSRVWTIREERRLAARKLEVQRAIEDQERCVSEARRRVKLVERLKERKHQIWQEEADRESDELASESAIAQWRRLHCLPSSQKTVGLRVGTPG
jgi:beta-glucosidase-like glycosyl hydrolase